MGKDIFKDIFDDIDKAIGNFNYKKGQRIKVDNILVSVRDHIIESLYSKSDDEAKYELDYYILKKKDGTVEIVKASKNLKREVVITKDSNDTMHWKVLGLEGDAYYTKPTHSEDNLILFFIPELDLETKTVYQFLFGSFLDTSFSLYNVKNHDSNYNKRNFLRKKHYEVSSHFAKSFNDFIKKINPIINGNKKYYIVSTVSYTTLVDMLSNKKCKKRKDAIVKNKILDMVENSANFVSILDLFSGWYYKAKNPISFTEGHYSSPVNYLNYLATRSGLLKYKKTKNINLRYLKNIMKKYSFEKDIKLKQEENTQFDLFEKLNIVYSILLILLYKKGGFAE